MVVSFCVPLETTQKTGALEKNDFFFGPMKESPLAQVEDSNPHGSSHGVWLQPCSRFPIVIPSCGFQHHLGPEVSVLDAE